MAKMGFGTKTVENHCFRTLLKTITEIKKIKTLLITAF